MKEILFKKNSDIQKRTKTLSISHINEDKDCKTHVKKSFIYMVSKVEEVEDQIQPPQIFIRKTINNKTREEHFIFEVKGYFFMSHQRFLMKVRFHHTLVIDIFWKDKIFSPKKSAVLT